MKLVDNGIEIDWDFTNEIIERHDSDFGVLMVEGVDKDGNQYTGMVQCFLSDPDWSDISQVDNIEIV